jgi:hypothetical protein
MDVYMPKKGSHPNNRFITSSLRVYARSARIALSAGLGWKLPSNKSGLVLARHESYESTALQSQFSQHDVHSCWLTLSETPHEVIPMQLFTARHAFATVV